MAEYVQLELDDKDKESLHELQTSMGQAEHQLAVVSSQLRQKETESKRSMLTAAELDELAADTPSYVQVRPLYPLHARRRAGFSDTPCLSGTLGRCGREGALPLGESAASGAFDPHHPSSSPSRHFRMQVGKMFLMSPLEGIRSKLITQAQTADKELVTLRDKVAHMKKVRRRESDSTLLGVVTATVAVARRAAATASRGRRGASTRRALRRGLVCGRAKGQRWVWARQTSPRRRARARAAPVSRPRRGRVRAARQAHEKCQEEFNEFVKAHVVKPEASDAD